VPAKNVYLDKDILDWIDKERAKEMRSFSNYLSKIVREYMAIKEAKWTKSS